MSRHRRGRPHEFELVDAADEFGDMGRGDATCKHKRSAWRESPRVPSRFDSYLEARSGLARDAHATAFHPTGAAVDAVSSYGPLQRHLAAGQRLREGGHARAWTRRSSRSAGSKEMERA